MEPLNQRFYDAVELIAECQSETDHEKFPELNRRLIKVFEDLIWFHKQNPEYQEEAFIFQQKLDSSRDTLAHKIHLMEANEFLIRMAKAMRGY